MLHEVRQHDLISSANVYSNDGFDDIVRVINIGHVIRRYNLEMNTVDYIDSFNMSFSFNATIYKLDMFNPIKIFKIFVIYIRFKYK